MPRAVGAMPCRGHGVYELLGTATTEDGRVRMAVLLRRRCDGHYLWSENAAIDVGDWQRAQAARHRAPRRGAGWPDIGRASGDDRSGCPTSISTFSRRSCPGACRSRPGPATSLRRPALRECEALRLALAAAKRAAMESRTKLTSGLVHPCASEKRPGRHCWQRRPQDDGHMQGSAGWLRRGDVASESAEPQGGPGGLLSQRHRMSARMAARRTRRPGKRRQVCLACALRSSSRLRRTIR